MHTFLKSFYINMRKINEKGAERKKNSITI